MAERSVRARVESRGDFLPLFLAHIQAFQPQVAGDEGAWLAGDLAPGRWEGHFPLGVGAPGWPSQPAISCFPDDNLSGTSGMEVDDRVSALEQRLQLQEDELAVLKAALADALRRLRACEEQGAALRARGTPKGRAPPRLGTTASGIFTRLEG